MFLKKTCGLVNPSRQHIARLATSAKAPVTSTTTTPTNTETAQVQNPAGPETLPGLVAQHARESPKYVLTSLRHFPSLKPTTFQPVVSTLLNTPLRRDLLWKAVVYDADNARVGASNPPSRNQMGYSRRKLAPQKGSGRARVGSRGSPLRHDGGRALANNAPNQHGTELQEKVYAKAMRVALSDAYRNGKLFVIKGNIELPTKDEVATEMFLKKFQLKEKKLLFITNELRNNLLQSTKTFEKRIDVAQKEGIKVKDILKPDRIFIELEALKFFQVNFGEGKKY